MIEAAYAALPVPTPMQTATGQRLWHSLMRRVDSYRDWFGEGMPAEWLVALEAIETQVKEATRQAGALARAHEQAEAAKQQELF